ncbi:hypothetical protein LG293_16565 (plasmid) [Citricoccus nitrophenolicus]
MAIAGGVVAIVLAGGSIVGGMAYSQDVGEVKLLRSFTGEVIDVDTTEGLSFKAPWVGTVDYSVRKQQFKYKGADDAAPSDDRNGPQITFTDKEKVEGNADIAIRYDLDSSKIEEIYEQYGTQAELEDKLIDQDMLSVVRNEFSKYSTAGVLEQREQIGTAIEEALKARWQSEGGSTGVKVDSVALQAIRYDGETMGAFNRAQQSITKLKEAQNNLEVEKANAENALVRAQGESKANSARSQALTPEVLTQQWIEAQRYMAERGTVFVVPEGSTPMVDVGSASGSKEPTEDQQ